MGVIMGVRHDDVLGEREELGLEACSYTWYKLG